MRNHMAVNPNFNDLFMQLDDAARAAPFRQTLKNRLE